MAKYSAERIRYEMPIAAEHPPRRSGPAAEDAGTHAKSPAGSGLAPRRVETARLAASAAESRQQHLVPRAEGRATSKERAVVPAAEDPRIFFLHHALVPATWERSRLNPENRPLRTYPVRRPDSPHEALIRPEYHHVEVPRAAAHGLALLFPPHTVHARTSTAVVVRTACELTEVDHVHIRRAEVAPDDALRSAEVEQILARARPGRDNGRVVQDLRRALIEQVERSAPTRAAGSSFLRRARSVRLGADLLTRLDSRYVVEITIIPAGAVLADNKDLARRSVVIDPDEPEQDPDSS